jgi:glycosyltransferase involved in cell wall biosynthesis
MTKGKTVLIIGKVWPEPNSSAAGARMMQLIGMLQEKGYSITFVSTAAHTDFEEDLTEQNIAFQIIKLNDVSFDTFVSELQPAFVIFDRYMTEEQFGWRVREQVPYALQVIDTEDLHFLRHARHEAVKKDLPIDLYNEVTKRELASILRADVSLIISEYEMDLLQAQFKIPAEKLIYLPLLFDVVKPSSVSFEERKGFVFIGNFYHEPNWDAVLQLKKHWPHIRSIIPHTKIHIYGAYPTQKVTDLHNEKEGFLIKGRAESAKEVIENARLLLAPIRFGAGLKGKLLEAMLYGTPSVTSSTGIEGIQNQGWNGLVCNNFSLLGEDLKQLYEDKATWQSAQEVGYKTMMEKFYKSLHENEWIKKLEELHVNLRTHRQQNFLGEILHHHSLQSTKYLAKWIEEKEMKK